MQRRSMLRAWRRRMKNWFEVDTEGLRALQKGKPKTFVIRELVQNCWDEDITMCGVVIEYDAGDIVITVDDDSPEGFKDLTNAYTLYRDTDKRKDAEKRGRFNLGNKELVSVCDYAKITTTKGSIIFNDEGRHQTNEKIPHGTVVRVILNGTQKEVDEMIAYAKALLVPPKIRFLVNGEVVKPRIPYKTFEAVLPTEVQDNGFLKKTRRKTKVNLIKEDVGRLYEMGLPVMDIDCQFGLDVQQKVPLSFDRDSVNQTFLKELYTETLNNMYQEIIPEHASDSWIRLGMSGKNISKDAIKHILTARYGDKFVVANRFDKNSIDEAISQGYRVVAGSELSKEEWENIRADGLMQSSSDLFGSDILRNAPEIQPDKNQVITAEYAKKIARYFLDSEIDVRFVKGGHTMVVAQYGNKCLTFNVDRLKGFFDTPIKTTSLILHELAHENGNHTEHSYHECLTGLAQDLVITALKEPGFFPGGQNVEG
jgi:hypothetical protein